MSVVRLAKILANDRWRAFANAGEYRALWGSTGIYARKGTQSVALTSSQIEILRLISQNRVKNGESYIAEEAH